MYEMYHTNKAALPCEATCIPHLVVSVFLDRCAKKEKRRALTASRFPLISSIRPAKNKKMEPWEKQATVCLRTWHFSGKDVHL